ncbi:MAG: hypothetical protein R6U15_01325 [Candidatus Izemoplasmatales bacterium]
MKFKKILISFILIFALFSMVSCSELNSVEKDFNEYGYYLVNHSDEYEEIINEYEDLENIFGVYDEIDILVGHIFEFKNKRALEAILDEVETNSEGIITRDNLMFSPAGPNHFKVVSIFNGEDPDEVYKE